MYSGLELACSEESKGHWLCHGLTTNSVIVSSGAQRWASSMQSPPDCSVLEWSHPAGVASLPLWLVSCLGFVVRVAV